MMRSQTSLYHSRELLPLRLPHLNRDRDRRRRRLHRRKSSLQHKRRPMVATAYLTELCYLGIWTTSTRRHFHGSDSLNISGK